MKKKTVTVSRKNYLEFTKIGKNKIPGSINCIEIDPALNDYQRKFVWRELKSSGYFVTAGKGYITLTVSGYRTIPTSFSSD